MPTPRYTVLGDWPLQHDPSTWGYVVATDICAPPQARFPYTDAGRRAAEAMARGLRFREAMDAALREIGVMGVAA